MNLNQLEKKLFACYSKELCYPKLREQWTEKNKCFGMCAITALIVNDYFQGQIGKIYVENVSHYFNIIDQRIVDLTKTQFKFKIDYSNYDLVEREIILTEDTKCRYQLLKQRLENKDIDE